MDKKLILIMKKILGKESFDKKITRYFFIIDNYLKGYPLSRIERKNKKDNNPSIDYIQILGNYLGINIDLNSELFENRLIKYSRKPDTLWVDRFFYRIQLCKENKIELTEEVVNDSMKMGLILYNSKYSPLTKEEKKKRITMIAFLDKQLGLRGRGRYIISNLLGMTEQHFIDIIENSNFDQRYIRLIALYNVILELTMIFDLERHYAHKKSFYEFIVNNRITLSNKDMEDESVSILNFINAQPEMLFDGSFEMKLIMEKYKIYIKE